MTLEQRSDWKRISAPDLIAGGTPSLIESDGGVSTLWIEGLGDVYLRAH